MWIATNRGFLSIVTANPAMLPKAEKKLLKGERALCVRARNVAHLKTLFPGHKVYQFPGRDYPARIFIGADQLAQHMADEVLCVDYPNFKSSVKDDALHDAYMAVWSTMHRYQHGYYKPRPHRGYSPLQSSFYDRFDGRPFNEQVPDDDLDDDMPCTTPGCTEDKPCLNCLTEALASDFDKADQKHDAQVADEGDRYGDFDSGDEADDDAAAESHRRIAP